MAVKPNITWVGSPNYFVGRNDQSVVAIVNHIMVGTEESTDGWFNNPRSQVSAHFGVAKDGRIHQYVALENAAWANGITEAVDPACDWLVNAVYRKINPNNLTVSIEHEGDTGDVFTEAQYQATLALHRWLLSLYPNIRVDRQHIIGHYQVMRYTKANCPGRGFPWDRLIADLALSHADTQSPLPPKVVTLEDPNAREFKETGYWVVNNLPDGTPINFYNYWKSQGLAYLGFPIGPAYFDSAYGRVVQWFERARLEYHPENPDAYKVQEGRTGAELLEAQKQIADLKAQLAAQAA